MKKKILISIFAIAVAIIACAPYSLKIPFIKNTIIRAIEKRYGISITIEEIELRWFSAQTMSALSISMEKEGALITCDRVSITAPLWKIAAKKDFEEVTLTSTHLTIHSKSHMESSISPSFANTTLFCGPGLDSAKFFSLDLQHSPDFRGHITVSDGSIDADGIQLKQIQASIDFNDKKPAFSLKAICLDGSKQGSISMEGTFLQKGRVKEFDAKIAIESLSVALLDKLAFSFYPEISGSFSQMLGPELTMNASFTYSKNLLHADASIQAKNTSLTLATVYNGSAVTLKAPASFSCVLPRQLLAAHYPILSSYSDIKVEANLDTLDIPVKDKSFIIKDLALAGNLKIQALESKDLATLSIAKEATAPIAALTAEVTAFGSRALGSAIFSLAAPVPVLTSFTVNADAIDISRFVPELSSSIRAPFTVSAEGFNNGGNIFCSVEASSPGIKASIKDLQLSSTTLHCPMASLTADTLAIPSGQQLLSLQDVQATISNAVATWPLEAGNIACNLQLAIAKASTLAEDMPFSVEKIEVSSKIQSLQDIHLQILSSKASLVAALGYSREKNAIVISGATASADLQALGVGQLTTSMGYNFTAAPVSITLSPCTFLLTPLTVDREGIKGRLNMAYASIVKNGSSKPIGCKDIMAELYYKEGLAQGSCRLAVENKGTSIQALKAEVKLSLGQIYCDVGIDKLPLSFIEPLVPGVSVLAEDTISGSIVIDKTETAGIFKASLAAEQASIEIELLSDGNNIRLGNNPATFRYAPAKTTVFIDKLLLPYNAAYHALSRSLLLQREFIENVDLAIRIAANDAAFAGVDANVFATITKQPGSKGSASLNLQEKGRPKQKGDLQLDASWEGVYSDSGNLLMDQSLFSINIDARELPSTLFGPWDPKGLISALSSGSLSAKINAEGSLLDAQFNANIFSVTTMAECYGKISKAALTLTAPATLQMNMTKQISHLLLQSFNPLSLTEIESLAPITLTVHPEGTFIPLQHFNIGQLTLPSVRLDLGQLRCHNEGNISVTLGLLRSLQLSQNETLALWFCPIDISLQRGIAQIDRVDVLIAELFNICLWGNIDTAKDNVDLVLGLTSSCLAKAFNINNLPEDYVLQIPMTGTLENVKLSTSKATAKIAALFAWQQATRAGAEAAGPAAPLLGPLLGKVAALPLNEKDTPKAKHPFPWERDTQASPRKKNKQARKGKLRVKGQEKPQDLLYKILR